MLIIPFDRKIDWRYPPLVTLVIIALNIFIYFIFQSDDQQRYRQAVTYYFNSELDKLELPHYEAYLKQHSSKDQFDGAEANKSKTPGHNSSLLSRMLYDKDFMQQLRSGAIIKTDDPDYSTWRLKRTEFERRQSLVTWQRFGLRSGEVEFVNLFAHFFLHGSIGHLSGNMLFLLAVGFIVEATLGSGIFLICYLLLGLSSTVFNIVLQPNSIIPGIGASGAIAGLMGLYALLFAHKRVSFFYFVFVYFDYIKAPAFFLLIAWIGYELYQQIAFSAISNVNYLAHLSGLCSGAILGLFIKYFTSWSNTEYIEKKDRDSEYQDKLEQAQHYMTELEYNKAKPILLQLQQQRPNDRRILYELYRIYKTSPASSDYHAICLRILELREWDAATQRLVADTIKNYLTDARPQPQLKPKQIERLALRLINTEYLEQAEQLLKIMVRNQTHFPELALVLSHFASAFQQRQQLEKAKHYQDLSKQYGPKLQPKTS